MNKQIPQHYKLAHRALDCDGVAVDVYADIDDGTYILGAVALTGDKRDIFDLLAPEFVTSCESALDRFVAEHAADMQAERRAAIFRTQRPSAHRYEREFCIG